MSKKHDAKYWRIYYREHKEERKECSRRYYKEHSAEVKDRTKKYAQKHKEKIREYRKNYVKKYGKEKIQLINKKHYNSGNVRIELSVKHGCNPDISPLQKEKLNLPKTEIKKYRNQLWSAFPIASTNNKSSNRKGVSYNKKQDKWIGYMRVNGYLHRKNFKTENEAVQYRIELENKYFTEEQLKLRDKYCEG